MGNTIASNKPITLTGSTTADILNTQNTAGHNISTDTAAGGKAKGNEYQATTSITSLVAEQNDYNAAAQYNAIGQADTKKGDTKGAAAAYQSAAAATSSGSQFSDDAMAQLQSQGYTAAQASQIALDFEAPGATAAQTADLAGLLSDVGDNVFDQSTGHFSNWDDANKITNDITAQDALKPST